MSLRRLAYAGSLMSSVVAIIAELSDWEHPLLWVAIAVAFLAAAGTVD